MALGLKIPWQVKDVTFSTDEFYRHWVPNGFIRLQTMLLIW